MCARIVLIILARQTMIHRISSYLKITEYNTWSLRDRNVSFFIDLFCSQCYYGLYSMIQRLAISEKDKERLSTAVWDPASQQDDFFDYSKVLIQKPWGHEYLLYRTSDVAVWVLNIKHGYKTSLHCHPNKKTSLAILSGVAECSTLHGTHTLQAGDGFLIDKGVFHSTAAVSPEGITVIETETPANKKDLVRAFDAYGRAGKGYEGSSCYTEIDGTVHCHFHTNTYGSSRRIGEFELAVGRYRNEGEFQRTFFSMPADVIGVLKGGLKDANNMLVFGVGDVMNKDEVRKDAHMIISQESEFLFINRVI